MPTNQRVKYSDDSDSIEVACSSLTASVGDILFLAAGSTTWAAVDGSTEKHWHRKAMVTKAVASASSVEVKLLYPHDLLKLNTTNNSAAADNGDRMVMSSANTVNNTGTDSTDADAIVVQEAVVGAAADKVALFRLLGGTGVDPDAT